MHALPDELCQDVFARLSGFEQRFDFVHPTQALSAFNEAVRTPFRIAATCARWRALVLNSPELWAFAHARDDRPADDAYLRMCMERSGQHPLDIWIHTSVKYSSSDSDDNADGEGELIPHGIIFGWLDLLRKNAHRWRRIRIDLPGSTPIDKFSPFMEPMPLLEATRTFDTEHLA
ncbi:hypothetical protein BKA62DRAFT_419502 [Auriculariales sp. MPI-PUGE-AT-0066]|nr:hypothetical protein BKA62DRAFT_419502 [Auriculariales sp. MPI-PUGE-AT-0066]